MTAVSLTASNSHMTAVKTWKEHRYFLDVSHCSNQWRILFTGTVKKKLSWVFHWVELGHMVTHSCKGGWEARNQRNLSHYLRLDIMIHALIRDTVPITKWRFFSQGRRNGFRKAVIQVNSKLWDLLQTPRKLQNWFFRLRSQKPALYCYMG